MMVAHSAGPGATGQSHTPYNREYFINLDLKRKYGMTREQYDNMLVAQAGVCAMCGQPETARRSGPGSVDSSAVKRLGVDHDHITGKVRALLCDACNRALGMYELRQPQINAYLAQHN